MNQESADRGAPPPNGDSVPASPDCAGNPARRTFLSGVLAVIAGALATLTPVFAGIAFLLDPLTRKRSGTDAGDGFIPVTDLPSLPADGTPVRFAIRADRWDAFTFNRQQPVGTVYLRRMPNGQVLAFNDTCPHLGCKVEYRPAVKDYLCPCHASAFALDGEKTNAIPPRGLDVLEARVEADGRVSVKYQEFRSGTDKKIPIDI